jgi:hypothetical protein
LPVDLRSALLHGLGLSVADGDRDVFADRLGLADFHGDFEDPFDVGGLDGVLVGAGRQCDGAVEGAVAEFAAARIPALLLAGDDQT